MKLKFEVWRWPKYLGVCKIVWKVEHFQIPIDETFLFLICFFSKVVESFYIYIYIYILYLLRGDYITSVYLF